MGTDSQSQIVRIVRNHPQNTNKEPCYRLSVACSPVLQCSSCTTAAWELFKLILYQLETSLLSVILNLIFLHLETFRNEQKASMIKKTFFSFLQKVHSVAILRHPFFSTAELSLLTWFVFHRLEASRAADWLTFGEIRGPRPWRADSSTSWSS